MNCLFLIPVALVAVALSPVWQISPYFCGRLALIYVALSLENRVVLFPLALSFSRPLRSFSQENVFMMKHRFSEYLTGVPQFNKCCYRKS
jgi:hypothetical protein